MSLDQQMMKRIKMQFMADCGINQPGVRIGRAPSVNKGFLSGAGFGSAVRDEIRKSTGITPRIYEGTSSFFRGIIMADDFWIMADECIAEWCEKEFSGKKKGIEWIGQFSELNRMNRYFRKYGHEILDCRINMLPEKDSAVLKNPGVEIRFLDSGDILDIRDPYPFRHALCDSELMPCEIAVAAVADGKNIGMAGATMDCDEMWQIGVDVLQGWRGKGIASLLTAHLKEKILEKGKIPFYSTSQTHIVSMNTALRAGFVPVWAEIFVK